MEEDFKNMKEAISTKMKILIGGIIAVVTGVLILVVYLFAPDPMPVDWSSVQKIPNNVTLLKKGDNDNPTDATALVKLNANGSIDTSDWKILQFTDMHLMQFHERNDIALTYFIETMKREKPDFVVLTGDIITRPRGRARAIQLAEMFEKMGVYWCYCLGNHEGDSAPFTLSREENVRIWSKYDHCLLEDDVKKTKDGEKVWGLGNTVINLLGENKKVVQSLIFMDSGARLSDEAYDELVEKGVKDIDRGSYDFLKESQRTWYEEQVRAVTDNMTNGVKTMLFIHIPLVEMGNVKFYEPTEVLPDDWEYAYPEEPLIVGGEIKGYMAVKKGWKLAGGSNSYEKCYCSDYNNGMYDLMKSLRAGVNALFCGHDHISNSILYEEEIKDDNPVYLCYGVCSGLQSYNMYDYGLSEKNDYALRGYAKITVHADSSFDLHQFRYNNIAQAIPCIVNGVACE